MLRQILQSVVLEPARWGWTFWNRRLAKWRVARPKTSTGRRHPLPGQLIVSVTSYPPRYGSLHLTIRSLLQQSVKPDRLILWIAHGDLASLPAEVLELDALGLEIRGCDDLRSYKKLVPGLQAFPEAFIVTADDDLYFRRNWLENLCHGFQAVPATIVCYRAVRPTRKADGSLRPFMEWQLNVTDAQSRKPSADIMAETGAGALFPPGSFHPVVTDRAIFQRVCPDADDLWFFWCARMAGTLFKKVGPRHRQITWPGSQQNSLWNDNRRGGNDRMIRHLEDEFGKLP